ncbi:MAG TPA: amidohydrolase family protein [Blastocatellia bacterium]|nr:amidohydrolase family protein [Blastocatellia bacterium]HMY71560.1 amidohydrolase family protein [Blastocatellia bacterium]HMZ19891.1 amidohydrolase family protein [Blastocatellia bacterium]HNG31496.1 amidohydrolase family protein [Blastocatellia bacterium]
MLDLKITGGTLVDGTGGEAFTADVGVRDGRIVEIGSISEAAQQTLSADGAIVTPGFVDIHTHFDGQATWDETFSPSIYHGVTTVVMGNCGVGFAPVHRGEEARLINLMEGVEDIPGSALAEGIRWQWSSFPEYLDALEAAPHSIDFLAQVPHDPLRMFVMGTRAEANEKATDDDIAAMRRLAREALAAGAVGLSIGRTDNHRTAEGKWTPSSEADARELNGLAEAFDGLGYRVLQAVSDFDLLRAPERFDAEFDLLEGMARRAARPLSMTWLQREPGAEQWKQIRARAEQANAQGLTMRLQTAARGIGVINGLDASFHPFMGFPTYKSLAHLPPAERAAQLRQPEIKARVLAEKSERLAGDGTAIPPLVDILLAQIDLLAARMFPLTAEVNYEPTLAQSFLAQAKGRGVSALEALYDYLTAGDGSNLLYFPIFNYGPGSLDVVEEMLRHPLALVALSDAGAHVGTVCDASFPTTLLSYWTRDRQRGRRLSLSQAVEMLTARNADYLGLQDRGRLAVGKKADINVINYEQLRATMPELKRDLPAGGKRFVQRADGFVATIVSGTIAALEDNITDARPGKLVRAQ